MTMVVAELEKTLSSCPAVDSVVSLLDGVVEKLSVLKRKVSAFLPSVQCSLLGFSFQDTFQSITGSLKVLECTMKLCFTVLKKHDLVVPV